jgi:hypothetical protein
MRKNPEERPTARDVEEALTLLASGDALSGSPASAADDGRSRR